MVYVIDELCPEKEPLYTTIQITSRNQVEGKNATLFEFLVGFKNSKKVEIQDDKNLEEICKAIENSVGIGIAAEKREVRYLGTTPCRIKEYGDYHSYSATAKFGDIELKTVGSDFNKTWAAVQAYINLVNKVILEAWTQYWRKKHSS